MALKFLKSKEDLEKTLKIYNFRKRKGNNNMINNFKKWTLAFAAVLFATSAISETGSKVRVPTTNGSGINYLYNSSFSDAGKFGFGLNYDVAVDGLESSAPGNMNGAVGDLENWHHSLHLGLGWKMASWMHLLVDASIHKADPRSDDFGGLLDGPGIKFGNTKLALQMALINNSDGGFGLGLVPFIYFNTANGNHKYNNQIARTIVDSDGNTREAWQMGADLVLDHKSSAGLIAMNLGYINREYTNAVRWGLGYETNFGLFTEILGEFNIDDPWIDGLSPMEAHIGYKVGSLRVNVGTGLNKHKHLLSPDLRAGIGYNGSFGKVAKATYVEPVNTVVEAPAEPAAPALEQIKSEVVNRTIKVGKVFFDTNKATIKPASYSVLDKLASDLNDNPGISSVRVEGYTDSRGSVSYNVGLSERRAASVVNYLSGKGISSSRLESKGYGPENPVATNATSAGRAQNRRVEFRILDVDDSINLEILE